MHMIVATHADIVQCIKLWISYTLCTIFSFFFSTREWLRNVHTQGDTCKQDRGRA